MSDYGTMQARIARELRRDRSMLLSESGTVGDSIKDAIQTAIQLEEKNRYFFNEGRANTVTEANKAYYATPSVKTGSGGGVFQNMTSMTITVNGHRYPLRARTFEYLDEIDDGTSTGAPEYYCIWNRQFRLVSIPDGAYPLNLAYQKRLKTLSADADSNEWMTDGEVLIRQMAKAVVLRDVIRGAKAVTEAQTYEAAADRARKELRSETTRRAATGQLMPSGYPRASRYYR